MLSMFIVETVSKDVSSIFSFYLNVLLLKYKINKQQIIDESKSIDLYQSLAPFQHRFSCLTVVLYVQQMKRAR